jgi:hypothetical protein
VDLGCHEGYPGHHVLNALLEEKLTKGKGWVEFSVYPLFSPQSLIAEGSANYGINWPSRAREDRLRARGSTRWRAWIRPRPRLRRPDGRQGRPGQQWNTVADLYLAGK